MGQKVNPYGFRLGITTDWKSRWFADKEYTNYLIEDWKIRDYLLTQLPHAAISRVEVERTRDRLRVALGVLDLEDVELHLLAGELLQLAAQAVGLGATATDDDARTRGVDVDADPVTGALDLDLGDAGPLHALGEQLADGDVLADVRLVELVGVPPRLVVGGDAEAEAVRVDPLAHQAFPFFRFFVAALA